MDTATLPATTAPATAAPLTERSTLCTGIMTLADASRRMAAIMHRLGSAARGDTDAQEAAWNALEAFQPAFRAMAEHLEAPDTCALIMGGEYQKGYEHGARYAGSFVRSMAMVAKVCADGVAEAQKDGAL